MFTDIKGIFFLVVCVLTVFSLFVVKEKKRFLLMMAVLFYPFSTGLIIYRYNGIMLSDFPLFALLALLLVDKAKFTFPKEAIPILVLAFWGIIYAPTAGMTKFAYSESLRFLRGAMVFIVIVNAVKTPKDLQAAFNALLIGLLFESLLSIYQWRMGMPLGLRFLGEPGWIGWRTRATFAHVSYFGNYLIFLVPLVFRMFVFYAPPKKIYTRIWGFVLFCGILALFSSMTRGPWVALAISLTAMIIYSLMQKKLRPKIMVPITIMIVFASAFFIRYLPKIIGQFQGERMASADIRMPLNRVAMRAIQANPIFGVGMGNYRAECHKYVVPEAEPQLRGFHIRQLSWDYVHNSFLLVTAESGLVGGFCFLGFFITVFFRGVRFLKKSISPYLLNLMVGILTGMFAIFTAFQFSPDIHIHQINVQFFIMTGLVIAIINLNSKQIRKMRMRKIQIQREKFTHENIRVV